VVEAALLQELINSSAASRLQLEEVYTQLPATVCRRRTLCCSLLPEMTLLEALQAIAHLAHFPEKLRKDLQARILLYFFLNPVEIRTCPFLQDRECLIYQDRFFGCRAYGLWSKGYHKALSRENRQSKGALLQEWKKLGVSLPAEVSHFQIPYCHRVKPEPPAAVDDQDLINLSDRIENLSRELGPRHREFREQTFSDLSFFMAGLQFGTQEAVRLKFFIVRDIIRKGDRSRLDDLLNQLADSFPEEPKGAAPLLTEGG
jgi:Fe-S-cluster containining protein